MISPSTIDLQLEMPMKIEINAKQAKILANLLMDEEMRISDRINRVESYKSTDELEQQARFIADLSVKVCTALAKKKGVAA